MPKMDIALPDPGKRLSTAPPVSKLPTRDKPIGVYDSRRAKREVSRPLFSRKVSR